MEPLELICDVVGASAGPWFAVQIWTRNHIYCCNPMFAVCFVVNRSTNKAYAAHPTMGARLQGGQTRDATKRVVSVSQPLPIRGSNALFVDACGAVYETSQIMRVVFRQRTIAVNPHETC